MEDKPLNILLRLQAQPFAFPLAALAALALMFISEDGLLPSRLARWTALARWPRRATT
jgi:hypothetical protein